MLTWCRKPSPERTKIGRTAKMLPRCGAPAAAVPRPRPGPAGAGSTGHAVRPPGHRKDDCSGSGTSACQVKCFFQNTLPRSASIATRSLLVVATKASSLKPRSVIARSTINGPKSEYTDRCFCSSVTFQSSCMSLSVSLPMRVSLRCQPSRELPPLCVVQSAPRTDATARHAARNVHVLTLRIHPTLSRSAEHAERVEQRVMIALRGHPRLHGEEPHVVNKDAGRRRPERITTTDQPGTTGGKTPCTTHRRGKIQPLSDFPRRRRRQQRSRSRAPAATARGVQERRRAYKD